MIYLIVLLLNIWGFVMGLQWFGPWFLVPFLLCKITVTEE